MVMAGESTVGIGRGRRALAAITLVAGALTASSVVSAGPASADVGASAGFTVPDGAGVGATNLTASITASNLNSPPNSTELNTLSEVKFAPSCGILGTTDNVCAAPDPGVFSISPTPTGAPGTACAGVTFTVPGADASGVFTFMPSSPVVLAPPGGGLSTCTINFTLNVLKVPTIDVGGSPGVQTISNLLVKETGNTSGLMPAVVVRQAITVNRGIPTFSTQASPSVPVGGTIFDTATLTKTAGAATITGTVLFRVFGPSDPLCAGAPVGQSTIAVGAGGTAQSTPVTAGVAGVYRFIAGYSGDANYVPLNPSCNSTGESVTVTGLPPTHRAVADFNGDGITDVSVFRPSTGQWLVKGILDTVYGAPGDIGVPGNYDANATTDVAVYRPSTGQWLVKGISETVYGASTDIPVPGDYNGDGITDVAVFRPSTGQWLVKGISETVYGAAGDIPAPGNWDGNATTDIAVFRPSTGQWLVKGILETVYGTSTDAPLPLPSAIRRAFFTP